MTSLFAKLWGGFSRKPSQEAPPPTPANWSIGIYGGPSPLALGPVDGIANPVLTAAHVTDIPAAFVADPFLFPNGPGWYLFFETMPLEGPGRIGLAESPDGREWRYRGTVLTEDFHLSYPHVFEWKGEQFMIPETRQTRSVRLYRAVDFPTRWRFEATLLQGKRFADASIFHDGQRWWMFTDSGRATLRLYSAPEPTGPWIQHRSSPLVKRDARIARPGGRVIRHDGHVYRFAQDDEGFYGRQVWGFRVLELDLRRYREEALSQPVIAPGTSSWNNLGMHHVDAHLLPDGRWMAAVDGCGAPE